MRESYAELDPSLPQQEPLGAYYLSHLARVRAANPGPYNNSHFAPAVPDITREWKMPGEVPPWHYERTLDADTRVIMVGGASFSGKSTVCAMLQQVLQEGGRDTILVRNDVQRNKYIPPDVYTHQHRFSWKANQRTLTYLLGDAWYYFWKGGDIAILDATWRNAEARRFATEVWSSMDLRCQFIQVVVDDEMLIKQRSETRVNDASTATFASYQQNKASADPIITRHILLKNEATQDALLARVRRIAANLIRKPEQDTV